MGELIHNHDEKQTKLRDIVQQLSAGSDVKAVKRDFDRLIRNVSPEEIAALEQGLIDEGVPVEQVQELCDIHVSVFQSALERQAPGKVLPGHPVHTYREENKIARRKAKALVRAARRFDKDSPNFARAVDELRPLELHYQRKENQLFPFLENVGFTGPSKVMWGKHDEIRGMLREIDKTTDLRRHTRQLAGAVRRMIFMEERILFPTALRKLPAPAWAEMRRGEAEIGYAWINPGNLWDANVVAAQSGAAQSGPAQTEPETTAEAAGTIPLEVGELLPEQIDMMLKALPVDVTFVDEKNKVRYYSGGPDRIFPRSPGVIGRDVANCHPPKSVHVVERIVSSFRKRERDSAEFWFTLGEKVIHIRYFAVYNSDGNYRGTVEMSQDVTAIRELTGEKKLLDWDD